LPALTYRDKPIQIRCFFIEGRGRLTALGAVDVKNQGVNEIRAA